MTSGDDGLGVLTFGVCESQPGFTLSEVQEFRELFLEVDEGTGVPWHVLGCVQNVLPR